ncbi:MAG TPA: histidinol-phosphate transaminase [Magnetospirillaceae bacterium]|jgi:histidinol-phosphate aminotransferase
MAAPQPRPGVLQVKPYIGGESQLPGITRVIKLASNESALGPSPHAIEAARADAEVMHRYPDGDAIELRKALGAHHGLDPAQIVCGAGSDEILHLICQGYCSPGDEVLYTKHGFAIYPVAAQASGATPVAAPEVNLTASVDNLLAAVTPKTKIVFLANPNNPTGTYISADELKRLRAGLPEHVLFVIDSAYAEFVGANDYSAGVELVNAGENTMMTRTFSKIYAMGGMRLGWAYCPPNVADVLNRVRGPFNVTSAALAAGKAALEDKAFVALAREHNDYWRPWLADELAKIGITTTPSVANFVLARFPEAAGRDAKSADAFLRKNGIIVRAMGGYHLPDCLRITIGTGEELRLLVKALTEFQKGNGAIQ